jgi:predicted Zn-dependent peptidase
LTIVTEKIESVKSVSTGIWAKTGSRNETDKQAGVTHFLEHMLFKGTESRSSYDIALSMESVGGYLNAFTSSEYTCYFARCLDTQIERALDVLSDMVLHPSFPEEEMVKEKKVVIEEMKMYRDSPSDYLFEHFSNSIFEGHPLGRSILGTEETVSSLQRTDLYDYMNDRYQPDNLLIAAAGNVDHDEIIRMVKAFFSGIKPQKGSTYDPALTPYKRQQQTLQKAIEQTHLILGRRSLNFNHDDKYKLLLTDTILGGGMSSRLHQNVREKYGYCYTISTFNKSYMDTGFYGVYVGTDSEYVDHVEELIFDELQRLQNEPVPQKEFEEAKAQLKGKLMLMLENTSNRMQRLAKSEIYYNRFMTIDELITDIEAVKADEVRNFAVEFFEESQFSKAVLFPENM